MEPFVVHLIIRNNAELNNGGARPIHEVMMQVDAFSPDGATMIVKRWHIDTFGPMDIEHVGTRAGTLARS